LRDTNIIGLKMTNKSDQQVLFSLLPTMQVCYNCRHRVGVQPLNPNRPNYIYCENENNLSLVKCILKQRNIELTHENIENALKVSPLQGCKFYKESERKSI
jgi:hypothetical protein